MALRVKLVRGMSGHPENHRETLRGLGLTRVGRERILQDTPAIRGMVHKVRHLVSVDGVAADSPEGMAVLAGAASERAR